MLTYYYMEAGKIKHITLNVMEYAEMAKKYTLYTSREEAKKGR